MKLLLAVVFFILSFIYVQSKVTCDGDNTLDKIPSKWVNMTSGCTAKMKAQVKEELTAALTYMAMGAHFSQDTVNRPGFAKFFFASANEEREHAIKILQYLMMRGEPTNKIEPLINNLKPKSEKWSSGLNALQEALKLEIHVTGKIREIIKTCEHDEGSTPPGANDYHLVDYLTGEFLEEQHKGQRDLAGKASTLQRMIKSHKEIGEFLFDKSLL